MEVHHPYPHKIVSFHEFLSPREADDLVAIAQPRMVKASVGHGKEVSEMRVSRNCWIKDFENGLVDKVAARINWITGLQTTKRLDAHKEGKESSELFDFVYTPTHPYILPYIKHSHMRRS
jgi:hypothetical protein